MNETDADDEDVFADENEEKEDEVDELKENENYEDGLEDNGNYDDVEEEELKENENYEDGLEDNGNYDDVEEEFKENENYEDGLGDNGNYDDVEEELKDGKKCCEETLAEDMSYYSLKDFEYEVGETRVPAARAISKNISFVLTDKKDLARGTQMFQKRRRRSEKFAIVGYGTQPTNDPLRSACETPDSMIPLNDGDDEIEAYDRPNPQSIFNQQQNNNKNNIETVKLQTKGRGAKLFEKRQQRMKKFVIEKSSEQQETTTTSSTIMLSPNKTTSNATMVQNSNSTTGGTQQPKVNAYINSRIPNQQSGYRPNSALFYKPTSFNSTNQSYSSTSSYMMFDSVKVAALNEAATEARNSCQAATMKGRGAKMFERQQQRMKKYTTEIEECCCPIDQQDLVSTNQNNGSNFKSNVTFSINLGAKQGKDESSASQNDIHFPPPSADDFISVGDASRFCDVTTRDKIATRQLAVGGEENTTTTTAAAAEKQEDFVETTERKQQETKITTTTILCPSPPANEKSKVTVKMNVPKKSGCRSVHQIKLIPKNKKPENVENLTKNNFNFKITPPTENKIVGNNFNKSVENFTFIEPPPYEFTLN